ncbi:MAG: hypothetical protein CL954_00715 [Erythrobacteraceae bacterium]|nr:hypothetical protein [Erythrobacteraceae bacterium]
MKKFLVAASCVALAACGSNEAEAPVEPIETADTTLDSTATGNVAGTYEVKLADGSVTMQTINADGTYVDTTPDGTRFGGGTWRTGDNGTMCFDPEGNDPEECYTGGAPAEDGAFEMRGEDGTVQSSVRKVEAQAMAAPSE